MEIIQEQKLYTETFKEKLGLWFEKFKPFLGGKYMWDIYSRIKEDSKTEKILPDSKNTFRSFAISNPDNIKVVMYCMDPYPRVYKGGIPQADGVPMSCSNVPEGAKLQPSLIKFYEGISKDLGIEIYQGKSLDYLVRQGVLLLNTDLTVKKDKTGSHEGLWEPFQKFFLEEVMSSYTEIIYVLLGEKSKAVKRYTNPLGNYIFEIEHPAAASYRNTDWNTQGIFLTINKILWDNNGYKIHWDSKEWDKYKESF